jgi:GT2 family glycosyltransferase
MNPALVLTHDNLDLTKACVESLRRQDIPVEIYMVDNSSSDGTPQWADGEKIECMRFEKNTGFSHGMNMGLDWIFRALNASWCLCPNSDTVLPPWYYRLLLEANFPVVSGVQHINGHRVTLEDLELEPPIEPVRPHPDFSALLWRREAWEALGGFDESMVNYASDCDMHIRAHRADIAMNHIHVPFYHYGSATIRNAEFFEGRRISEQAVKDGAAFRKKYGCDPGTPEYNKLFE